MMRSVRRASKVAVSATLLLVVTASQAQAQTPTPWPDVKLRKTAGVYNVRCLAPTDTDMASICFVRSDPVEVIELGCVAAGPSAEVSRAVTVVQTPNDDAEIRCYAVDTEGLVSDYSDNSGTIDFTPPGKGRIR